MTEASVLIFGVNGFVGGYLAREFASHGYRVYGSDRALASKVGAVSRYWAGDISQKERVEEICSQSNPNIIVNLAAISSVSTTWLMPQDAITINVNGTINILEAAKNLLPTPKILLIGSSEEYAPSTLPLHEDSPVCANNPYGISKMAQERFANIYEDRYGLRIYRTRSFNHAGIGQSTNFVLSSWCMQVAEIEKSGQSGVVRVGNIDIKRDFTDVVDVAAAYRMIVEGDRWGDVFNVGSGKASSLRDLLSIICSFSGCEITVMQSEKLLRPVDNPTICSDCSKIRQLIGWQPTHSIEETLKNIYQSYLI